MESRVSTYIFFNSPSKIEWISNIIRWRNILSTSKKNTNLAKIRFSKDITKKKLAPFHIVTLSCFIELLKKKNYLVTLIFDDSKLHDFIKNDISITKYWKEQGTDHVDSPDPTRLNLWRVTEKRQIEYETSVHSYFTNKFPDIDFFMLKSCLSELYYNVFDHADANGIAFSYIHYDKEEEMIHIAICDFGKGIAKTIRDAYSDIPSDKDALVKSLEKGVSARSTEHNAGFGLDNIISSLSDSTIRIVSNRALLVCHRDKENVETKAYDLPFYFQGTIIYLDLPISGFEKTEINDVYTFC